MATARALAALTALVGLAAGCGGGDTAAPSPDAADGVAEVEEAAPPAASPQEGSADEESLEASAATAAEVADICRVYRAALRGRWDDQRTREEVRVLDLTSDAARVWQADLVEGGAERSLAASRSVVDAAQQLGQISACEPLAGLVSLAESMQGAPDTFEP